ncbi:uncharacterized protein LOC142988649 [Genypterus blacodes]|uniref:uncharacterized protein LOC142988649 n=1 Tax=Genypterus blacodes TaxID=154954 RepID=UPI003F770503
MLAKILEDMWVEPEVLEALGEEQKRILFLKMREEQVRRWREREEKEGEDVNLNRPKKASSKRVTWLLGRDGDVSAIVIGEMDEFRSSKLLHSLMNNNNNYRLHSDNMNGIQTGGEAQRLGFKDMQLPLADVTDDLVAQNEASSEEEPDSCSPEDDLRDPSSDSDTESGSGSDSPNDWAPLYRPHLSSHGNQAPLKAPLSDTERARPESRDVCYEEQNPAFGGRVAALRKTFTPELHGSKPPVPTKPPHLHTRSSPLFH